MTLDTLARICALVVGAGLIVLLALACLWAPGREPMQESPAPEGPTTRSEAPTHHAQEKGGSNHV